jgi:hypothetical protein
MLTVHRQLAFLVIAVSIVAALLALVARRRGGTAGTAVAHALALAQTLVVAEVAFGLLLLADDRHAEEGVHYMYGSLAVLAVAWPFLYAGATLTAAVLAIRAYMTA